MTERLGGALFGLVLGTMAMLAPIGVVGWFPAADGYVLPEGVLAAIGSAVAGWLLVSRVTTTPRARLGLLALGFALLVAIAAAPLVAIQGAIWSVAIPPEPGDELFHPGVVGSAVLDVAFFGPLMFLLALPQGIVWVWLLRRLQPGSPK